MRVNSQKDGDFMSRNQEKFLNQPLPDYEELFESNSDGSGKAPFGVLSQIFKGNYLKIIFATFLHMVDGCGNWVKPLATANIINAVTDPSPGSLRVISINSIVLILAFLLHTPFSIIYSRKIYRILRTIGAGLRNTLVRKLQHLSLTYHKEIESGKLQSKFLRDIEAIEAMNHLFIKMVVPTLLYLIIYTAITWTKSKAVTLFFLFVVPVNVLLIYLFRRKISANNRDFRHENENVSANVTTMIEMIPVTKAHGLEEEEIAKLEERIRLLKNKGFELDNTNAFFGSALWVVSNLLSIACLIFTSFLAYNGKIGVGDIMMYQTFFASISANVQTLLNMYPDLTKGMESLKSVSEVMLSPEIEDDRDKIRLRYVHGSIDFENVYFRYQGAEEDTIKDFSLSVNPGECVAFVGASGSGKSTIINMIIGFLLPTGGTFKMDGKPIEMLSLPSYRQFISVVPQNTILFKGTIRDNILYGINDIDEKRFEQILESANINEFLPLLPDGINTVVGEHGDKLSGGQKQRISIARALIRDPKILILDEATSALDNISEHHVQKAISSLVKDRTTFIVAHRLSTIRNADKIVVMDKGRIVEVGTYEELVAKKGAFYELKKLNEISTED
jgi:ATP-binding cassette subfamily B protein